MLKKIFIGAHGVQEKRDLLMTISLQILKKPPKSLTHRFSVEIT